MIKLLFDCQKLSKQGLQLEIMLALHAQPHVLLDAKLEVPLQLLRTAFDKCILCLVPAAALLRL